MDSSNMGLGFMAAFAVSGSVVLIARQVHKRLLSDFMKKIEFELTEPRRSCQQKKRVRFAEDVREATANKKENRNKSLLKVREDNKQMKKMEEDFINQKKVRYGAKLFEAMPENRKILYQGILKYRTLQGCKLSSA